MPWRRIAGVCLILLVTFAFVVWFAATRYGLPALERWTASPAFQEMLSREVSKSMKVDGQFGPLTITGMEARTPSYTSEGWPGEAIGSLKAEGIHGVFNPWAILRRIWQVDRITIEKGTFALRLPNDALKRPVIKGPKPWYAILMPTRFYCPEILCPDALVEFPFQGKTGRLSKLNLKARMIRQDFEYRADSGRFEFPLFPEMNVEELNMFITREMVDIRVARLGGIDGDPGRAVISGRLGMREDKSIRAKVELDRLPFGRALPTEWVEQLDGRLTGKLDWNTDATGLKTASDGVVLLEDVSVRGWAWLDHLARVHDNPDLKGLRVPRARCAFNFDGANFQIRQLEATIGNLLTFRGEVDYHSKTFRTRANLTLDSFDLKSWMPGDFKHRVEARGRGDIFWEGSWKDPLDSTASGHLQIPASIYRFRPVLIQSLKRYGVELPKEIDLEGFDLHFTQAGHRFDVNHIGLTSTSGLTIDGYGHWVNNQSWELNMNIQGLDAGLWKPKKGSGKVQGKVALTGQWISSRPRLGDGKGTARIQVENARLTNFEFQKTLARFLKTDEVRDFQFRDFELSGAGDAGAITVENLRMFTPGKMGLEGTIHTSADGKLSGTVWLGLPSKWLTWLPDAEKTVFTRKKEGLSWAKVKISGTSHDMKQDLTAQIMRVLRRHPLALIGLGFRAASWWLGDVLGTYQEK
jgi:hypothetical protein